MHQLKKSKNSTKKRSIKGRGIGSGIGKTCGKGHKGQRARSGHMKLGFEGGQLPLYRRVPKFGFFHYEQNKNRNQSFIINVNVLNKKFNDGDMVNIDSLKQKKIIKKCKFIRFIKILGKGKLEKKISIDTDKIKISKNAENKIKNLGGAIKIKEAK
ncbi:MAG: 50S ribosomal protein L15 [Bacilli bacterium]|nr:50S ribosomal protein L15 [Bacilli bacterium]